MSFAPPWMVQFTGRKLNEALGENPIKYECVHYVHVNQVMQNIFCDVRTHTQLFNCGTPTEEKSSLKMHFYEDKFSL